MNSTISEIKERANRYKELILKKEEVFKEFQSWHDLYKEAQEILIKAEEFYKSEQTEEAGVKYENWIKECRDYLAIVFEYSEKFEEINQELNTYDAETMKEQIEYLSNLTKFQMISDKMKEIEKRSKKIAGGATIGTGYVTIMNAEGRNKNINETYASDYAKLAEEKKALAKVVRKQYIAVINKIEVAEEPTIDESQANVDPDITPAQKNEYDILSTEDKIMKLEEKMQFYRNASGRKQRVKYCGEVITLPRYYVGAYLICASELKRLQKGLNNTSDQKPNIFYEALNYVKKNDPSIDVYSDSSSLLLNKTTDEIVDEVFEGFTPDVFKQNSESNKNLVSAFEDEQFDRENEELFAVVNKHHDEYVAKMKQEEEEKKNQTKTKGFMKILNIKKPVNKTKLKDIIKRAAIGIATGTIVLTSAIISTTMAKLNIDTNKNNNELSKDEIVSELNEEEQEELDKVTDNIIWEDSSTTATQVEEEFIKLGDKFYINDNSNIYNTMYDATLARGGLRPYFSAGYEREVGGLAINYEGELYFFYSTDANAQENINMLITNGGKITSVLSQNASGYEGFYNINDVNSLSNNLGGMNR